MKKNVLALSIAAAIGGLGFAGGAFAVTTSVPDAGTVANYLYMSPQGIGHMLMVPYYSAQASNSTLLNIVNTDTLNAKAVKVRFRGAANSDDVYDFQVFLSPGDVWTGNVSQDTATGLAKMTTSDSSCTKPENINLSFGTKRLHSTLTDAKKAENTREGYVEIFNMADIPPTRTATALGFVTASNTWNGTNTGTGFVGAVITKVANELYTAVKHVAGAKPPCSGDAWVALDTDREYSSATPATTPGYTDTSAKGIMANPTTGLMGDWTVINIGDASAWGSAATAILATDSSVVYDSAAGALVYFPQMPVAQTKVAEYTADPLFAYALAATATATASGTWTSSFVAAQQYDLPDMSTPYVKLSTSPTIQASALTAAIAVTSVKNEFLTDPLINATTDWVFSMPTRRYSMAVDYEYKDQFGVNKPRIIYNWGLSSYFSPVNTSLSSAEQICVSGISFTAFDRSEQYTKATITPVISPATPDAPLLFCGEASVLTINDTGATESGVLHSTVAMKNLDVTYVDGWMSLSTGGLGYGLPILGASFVRATAGASTFGANWDHRFTHYYAK